MAHSSDEGNVADHPPITTPAVAALPPPGWDPARRGSRLAGPRNPAYPEAWATEKNAVILTGAGISAESGLPTFRDKDGLWEGYRVEEVACPQAFRRDPELVHRFYNLRRAALKTVEPNAAHHALARLQQQFPGTVTLVTQNVDDLHERAGSTGVIHMHGELRKIRCLQCGHGAEWVDDLQTATACPACGRTGGLRPDIVWFGEIPYQMDRIETAARKRGRVCRHRHLRPCLSGRRFCQPGQTRRRANQRDQQHPNPRVRLFRRASRRPGHPRGPAVGGLGVRNHGRPRLTRDFMGRTRG